ncbi:hypothetical protein BH09PAT3_BH09PAT3_5470 [soil metagenome]
MRIIAGAIIRDTQGRYLLVQERQEKVRGLWNIPAGWADNDESPDQAAIRETKEEVGMDIVIGAEPLHRFVNEQKQSEYYAFLAQEYSGELVVQANELLDAKWLSYQDVVKLHAANQIREPWIFNALEKAEHAYSRH